MGSGDTSLIGTLTRQRGGSRFVELAVTCHAVAPSIADRNFTARFSFDAELFPVRLRGLRVVLLRPVENVPLSTGFLL